MSTYTKTHEELLEEVEDLRRRLEEFESTVEAIKNGEVDAVVVYGPPGEKVYTLEGADQPYRRLIESIHQGAVTLSTDGTILYCNRCLVDLLQRPARTVVGAPLMDFLVKGDQPVGRRLLQEALLEVRQEGEVRFEREDGTFFPARMVLEAFGSPDSQVISVVVTDLTQQKNYEELAEAKKRLAEIDQHKDEFLAMLAHELRNPLAPISNAVEVLRRQTSPDPNLEWARDVIDRQVKQMTRLVNDLLDVSRIAQGKVQLQKDLVEVSVIIDSAVETCRPLIEARRHELTMAIPKTSVQVYGDLARLAQVVANLLNNAAKYTPEGGVIALTVEQELDQVLIRVRDNGSGIPKDMLPHIFGLFTQVNRLLERSQGGLGIGLALVKNLVELHGGKVEASSNGLGQGSEFTVHLPLAVHASESKTGEMPKDEPRGPGEGGCRILVVDDDTDSAQSLEILLGIMGHEVRTSKDGPSALEVAAKFIPDVVLLDIGLPGMSGYEVARRLRALPPLNGAMLVAQTGWAQEEDQRHCKEAGFDYHLVKPVDTSLLRELLATRKLRA